MILYHASKEVVEFPEIRKTRYTKDFSWGFYCTNNFEQAVRINRKQFWVLAEFRYPTHQISFHTLSALNCLVFDRSEIVYDR